MTTTRPFAIRLIFFLLPALWFAGCGGAPYYETLDHKHLPRQGVYHHVLKGQNLYAIVEEPGFTESCVVLFEVYWEKARTLEEVKNGILS